MQIDSIEIQSLHIPFKVSFKHTNAERKKTQSVLVKVQSNDLIGMGEGCPRSYVTNESIDSAILFFEKHKSDYLELTTIEKLKSWVEQNSIDIDKNPAAWCAVELALLDLISKEQNKSVDGLLGLPELNGSFQYSAILGDSKTETTIAQVSQFDKMGFKDFKLKITGDPALDNEKISIISKQIAKGFRIRLDANNLWKSAKEVTEYLAQLNYPIFAIEEPIQAKDYKGLDLIIATTNTKIILDESFLSIDDFTFLKRTENYIINLRVSKMGGLLRSLEICKKAVKMNISIIVGAQVGETSILSRAALTISNNISSKLIGQEGAFGTLLLVNDIVESPIVFGHKGVINAYDLKLVSNFGFGLNYVA